MMEVKSVSEYVSYIETIKQSAPSQKTLGCFTFFRGQANREWELSPSLFRQGLFQEEQLLIQYTKHSCPREFSENKFETLVKLQHFGLPTRLLDTTTNPLVALFFACFSEERSEVDGAVYVFPNLPVTWSDDPLVDLVMEYVFNGLYQMNLSDFMNSENVKSKNYHTHFAFSEHDLLRYLSNPALAVMPEKSNPRILAQDGAFFLCGMKKEKKVKERHTGSEYYIFAPAVLTDSYLLNKKAEKIIIPSSAKEGIVSQLDIMGINEAKLFPDLAHQTRHAVKYVKQNHSILEELRERYNVYNNYIEV